MDSEAVLIIVFYSLFDAFYTIYCVDNLSTYVNIHLL